MGADKADGESLPDDREQYKIVKNWSQISQRLDANHDYLILQIEMDRFSKMLFSNLQHIIDSHNIEPVEHKLYCDKKTNRWFLVFRLKQNPQPIGFESLYFDLPAGVDFHFISRSPVSAVLGKIK